MVKDAVSINIRVIHMGLETSQITQIGAIWLEGFEFKSINFHIKNSNKNSNESVSLENAMILLEKIIRGRSIILFNNQGLEEIILKDSFKKFNIDFNSKIYDLSKESSIVGVQKNNLMNLTKIYDVFKKNTHDLPTALYKARQVYLVASKMFDDNE